MDLVRDVRLVIPPLPPQHVPRPRQVADLGQTTEAPLTLISAGPGAGKTVLVTEWAEQVTDRVVWVRLSPADSQPARFLRLLRTALHQVGVDAPGADELLDLRPPAASVEGGQALMGRSDDTAARVVLVLDGAHLITDPELLRILDSLVRGCSDRMRLILIARSDPLLPLHRYRLTGLMRELRSADLAMTIDETRAVLAAHGVTLAPAELEALQARTEGWVAGVRLSAMRMEGSPRPADFVHELAVDQGSIGEYLLEEVLAVQSPAVRRMLIETSILDEVSGPLASAVTGIDGCGELLDRLAHHNSFVVPVDSTGTSFRYHQLFRDMLRYLLQRSGKPEVSILCGRAARWFEGTGDMSTALYWTVQQGDADELVRLLTEGALVHAFVHRRDLGSWGLAELPLRAGGRSEDEKRRAVALRVVGAISADGQSAAEMLADKQPAEYDTDVNLLVSSNLAELILGQKAGRTDRVRTAAANILDSDLEGVRAAGLRPAVMLAAAMADFCEGRYQSVDTLLTDCVAEADAEGYRSLKVEALGEAALFESFWTRPRHAKELAVAAETVAEASGLEIPASLQLAKASRAMAMADLAEMDRVLQRISLVDMVGSEPAFESMLTLARASCLMLSGREFDALALLEAPARYAAPPLLATFGDAMLASIETRLGRPRAALHILEKYPTPYQRVDNRTEAGMAYLVAATRALTHLALGDLDEADACARLLLSSTSPQVGRFQIVQGMMCAALIAHARNDDARAVEMAVRALQVGEPDIRLPLVEMTEPLRELLESHPTLAEEWPENLSSRPRGGDVQPSWSAQALPERLTDRERAILRLLSTSMSISEIAAEMYISVNTVKTHLAAIYRKLAARKRREAVFRARELELL